MHKIVPQIENIDKIVDVPVMKILAVPQIQCTDKIVDVPLQKNFVSQIQYVDKIVDVPDIKIPAAQKFEKTVEVPQIQCIDKIVDVPLQKNFAEPMIQKASAIVESPPDDGGRATHINYEFFDWEDLPLTFHNDDEDIDLADVPDDERAAVRRLADLKAFTINQARHWFLFCNKNEEMAAEFISEHWYDVEQVRMSHTRRRLREHFLQKHMIHYDDHTHDNEHMPSVDNDLPEQKNVEVPTIQKAVCFSEASQIRYIDKIVDTVRLESPPDDGGGRATHMNDVPAPLISSSNTGAAPGATQRWPTLSVEERLHLVQKQELCEKLMGDIKR